MTSATAWRIPGLLLALVLLSAQGCPPPEPPRPVFLERADVQNLPPGDATGSALSGRYRAGAAVRESCECLDTDAVVQDAFCGPLLTNPDYIETITQDGGQLAAFSAEGGALFIVGDPTDLAADSQQPGLREGHFYADGTYQIGSIKPFIDPATEHITGETLSLWSGSFDGQGLYGTARFHSKGVIHNNYNLSESWPLDCEFSVRIDLLRVPDGEQP